MLFPQKYPDMARVARNSLQLFIHLITCTYAQHPGQQAPDFSLCHLRQHRDPSHRHSQLAISFNPWHNLLQDLQRENSMALHCTLYFILILV